MIIICILFAILLWNFALTSLGKADKSRCYCGMVGYCGSKPADANLIRILMMYNQTRGEDSTGWAINNEITKDCKSVIDFLQHNQINISEQNENFTIIAHARKSSSGQKGSKEHAHPFGMYKNGIEKDKYDLILAMNGTMLHVKDFADHFKQPYEITKHSDTQLLSKVIVELGDKNYIEALEKYNGTATLLYTNPRWNNTLFAFKDPDKALFYWQMTDDQMYISSIKEAFAGLGAPEAQIHEFKEHVVYRIYKGRITKELPIARDPLYKPTIYDNTYHDEESYYNRTGSWHGGSVGKQLSTTGTMRNITPYNSSDSYYKIDPNSMKKDGNKVYFMYDKYFRAYHPLTGEFYINWEGNVKKSPTDEGWNTTYMLKFFIGGYMMKDVAAYEALKTKCFKDDDIDWPMFQEITTSELIEYVNYPILIVSSVKEYWILPEEDEKKNIMTKGSTIEISSFLSEYELILTYDSGLVTQHNGRKCLSLKSWRPKNIGKNVNVSFPETSEVENKITKFMKKEWKIEKIQAFFTQTISKYPDITAEQLYDKTRIELLRMNYSPELTNYFYPEILLNYLYKKDMLNAESFNSAKKEGNRTSWCYKSRETLDQAIGRYARKLNDPAANQSDIEDIEEIDDESSMEDVIQVSFDRLNARDKIQTSEDNLTPISLGEALQSIKVDNKFLRDESLLKAFYDPCSKDLTEFSTKWVDDISVINRDTIEFNQAIAILLEEVGCIDKTKLINYLKQPDVDLCQDVAVSFADHYEQLIARDAKAITNFTSKDYEQLIAEDDESIHVEDYTPEDFEKEAEAMLKENMESWAQMIQLISDVPESNRTDRTKIILKQSEDQYHYLQKYLYQKHLVLIPE